MAYPLGVQQAPILMPPARSINARIPIRVTAGRSYNYTGGIVVSNQVFYIDATDYAWFLLWAQVPTGLFRYGAR